MFTDLALPFWVDLKGHHLAILLATTLLVGLFRGFSGFGAGIFLVPIYSLLLSPSQAIVLMNLLNIPTSAQMLPRLWRDIPWRHVLAITSMTAITIPFGVWLLVWVDHVLLTRMIGALVICLALLMLSGWRYSGKHSLPHDLAIGVTSGLLSGSTGIGGPPIIFYFLSGAFTARTARAAFVFCFSCITVVALASLIAARLVGWDDLIHFLILLPAYIGGTWLGSAIFQRYAMYEKQFRMVALSALFAVGILTVLG